MPKGGNKMNTKSDDQFLAIEATTEANKQEADKNKQEADKNHKETTENIKQLTETLNQVLAEMKDKNNISKSSPSQKDTSTLPDPTNAVQTNRRAPLLEGGISENIGGMWTLRHEISSPKFYELLIKTELKGDTALDIKNSFDHIMMCLNVVTKIIEYLLPDYQSIKRHSQFEEHFIPDSDHPS